jgi:energy-coupling factor transporter ATP-binding protein EcfA2
MEHPNPLKHPRPPVFVSCVSHELGQIRTRVSEILEGNGFTPMSQDHFGTESGDLRQVLRDKIDACHGLIHIVGHAYGVEPPTHEPEFGRVSYTQFEFHYARKKKKRTWLLFADHGCSRDRSVDSLDLPHNPAHPDPVGYQAECRNLQLAYRIQIEKEGHVFYTAVNDAALEKFIEDLNAAALWQSVCWDELKAACDAKEQATVKISGYAEDRYYQKRAIEETFSDFLQNRSERGMIIVGESGMGKTTLLVHLASVCSKEKHLYRMFNGGEFIPSRTLEPQLIDGLGFKNRREQKLPVELFWPTIDAEGERLGKYLLVFIDAINEYNPEGSIEDGPVGLMRELDQIISRLKANFGRVKFVVTTRPEVWRAALRFAPTCFQDEKVYFTPQSVDPQVRDSMWTLSKFSPGEFEGAYEKYRAANRIKTEVKQLSPLAAFYLHDPFLLQLAGVAYKNREIPLELDTNELFDKYYETLKKVGPLQRDLQPLINDLVAEMFVGDTGAGTIQQTSFSHDTELRNRKPNLFNDLDFSNRASLGFELREKHVIREWQMRKDRGGSETRIRFTYDRFAEYLLAKRLLLLIEEEAAKPGVPLEQAAKSIFQANLAGAQRDPVVQEALQEALSLVREEIFEEPAFKSDPVRSDKYVAVLKAISEIDPRCQWLVVSSLTRTARANTGGIELIEKSLNQLNNGRSITGPNFPVADWAYRLPKRVLGKLGLRSSAGKRFPVVEAVYHLLINEDYHLWLDQQQEAIRQAHLNALYDHLVSAFQADDVQISAAAVQYVFFLWNSSSKHGLTDALNITKRLANEVKPPSQMVLSAAECAAFRSLVTLMIMVLSEAPRDRFTDALEIAQEIMRKLNLKKLEGVASFLLNSVLLNYFLSILDALPNPIQLATLKQYCKNRDTELRAFEEVLALLDPAGNSELTLQTLKRLSKTDNGFVAQMLTYVISTRYERAASPEARAEVLLLAQDMFYEEPRSEVSRYCSSLALYHINFFGSHANRESMRLMDRMARSILKEHQGRFTISGKRHTFCIVGTYGRSLSRNGFDTEAMESPAQSAMQYAMDALKEAKESDDAEFYLHLCQELGQLGVLAEPKYLFSVFTEILKDVRALDEPTFEPRFSRDNIRKAKETVLQSLANMRVLYRQHVDEYLLQVLEKPEIYAEVATERTPDVRLSYFMSWAFEQLTFHCLADHKRYESCGRELMQALLAGARCRSPAKCVSAALLRVVRLIAKSAG